MEQSLKIEYSQVDIYLDTWKVWMSSQAHQLGYPSKSPGFHSGYVTKHMEDFYHELDTNIARAVDACLESMPPVQSAAIYHTYLAAVFRFPRDNHLEALESAKSFIEVKMKQRGFV